MNKSFIFLVTLILVYTAARGQEWSMEACIKYAQANNLSIKDDEINARLADLSVQQTKMSQLPSVNGAASYGRAYSRVPDASGTYGGQGYGFTSFVGTADVLIFGWFARKNQIAKSVFAQQAANATHDQLKQDVSLNVATGYLRALLAKERIGIARKQIEFTTAQLGQARMQVRAGTAAELGSVLLQSQLATDSTNYLYAQSVYNSAILDLKALLAVNAASPLNIMDPEAAMNANVTAAGIASEQAIYDAAVKKLGKMRAYDLNVEASQKQYKIADALRYPRLSFVTQLSTIYTNIGKDVSVSGYNNVAVPSTYIDVNGTQYPVYQSTPTYDVKKASFGAQLGHNFSSIYALSLNVPIFNGFRGQYGMHAAGLQLQAEEYKRSEATLELRNDIYKACDEARLAAQKYNAARSAVDAAQSAMYFSQKRLSTGLMTTIEYLQVQNSMYGVKEQLLAAKYDYILKMKIIDYYMGKDLAM